MAVQLLFYGLLPIGLVQNSMHHFCEVSIFFFRCFIKVQLVQAYNSTDMRTVWKNSHFILSDCPVSWSSRIHQLHLCRGVRPPARNECPGYETKKSNREVPVILELWRMWSTPSLPSLPGPLWPVVVAPDRALPMGQIELNCFCMLNWIVLNRAVFDIETVPALNWIAWNRNVSEN